MKPKNKTKRGKKREQESLNIYSSSYHRQMVRSIGMEPKEEVELSKISRFCLIEIVSNMDWHIR